MTKDEALKLALEALKDLGMKHYESTGEVLYKETFAAIKEALAQPEQKYRRGNRLICLETEEFCVIHISGTDRQWVKFPDSHIGVYTNEQVAELFELLPKEPEQEPVAWEGGEGWESLAWELCADENGEDSCNELIWEGGPIPAPWGDRWMKYEEEAKRLIALVQKHTTPPQQDKNEFKPDWDEKLALTEEVIRLSKRIEELEAKQEPWRESASDYERGVVDGRQMQVQSSVDKAVNAMTQRTWVGLTNEEVESLQRLAIDPVDANGWGFLNRERFAYLIEIKLKAKNT